MTNQPPGIRLVRRAVATEAPLLEALQQRSVEHWGLPAGTLDWPIDAWDVSAQYVEDNPVYCVTRDDLIVGFYGLTKYEGNLWLDKLYVESDQVDNGLGRLLWRHAAETARSLGYLSIDIDSSPNAAPFYAAMGATRLAERKTSNPSWTFQQFRYQIPVQSIRPAKLEEAAELHALTGRSVLYWGYEPAFLDWEPEAIAVTPEFLARTDVWVLEIGGTIAGYYALWHKDDGWYLDKLFVDPTWIGTGLGKLLWHHAIERAQDLGATQLEIESDPNAAPFYAAMGARWTREIETSWPDWRLQVFEYPLEKF